MKLNEAEKVTYLANLIFLSRADQAVSPNESQVIELAQKRIGAKKSLFKKAELLAQSDDFTLQPIGSFSMRIANLEDMIEVAVADGTLDDAEKSAVVSFAKSIGITNGQFHTIFSEIKE